MIVKLYLILLHNCTAPPGQPRTLSVETIEAVYTLIHWEAPFVAKSPISCYAINTHNLNRTAAGRKNDVVVVNTITNVTFFNVTGLLPGTTYELTVVAVSHSRESTKYSSNNHNKNHW